MKTPHDCLIQAFNDFYHEGAEMELRDFLHVQPDWVDAVKDAMRRYANQKESYYVNIYEDLGGLSISDCKYDTYGEAYQNRGKGYKETVKIVREGR